MKRIPITLEIAAVTDIGRRRACNEDNFFVNGAFIDHYKVSAERFESVDTEEVHVLAVCDGMGGLDDGEVAAMTGVTTLSDYADELQAIRTYEDASFTANRIIRTANDRLLKRMKKHDKKMGSTFAMLVASVDCLYACNLGDSEIYLKTRFGMERLSKPQTVAQELVDRGAISENQANHSYARNQLSKYLGMENTRMLKPNESSAELRTGDILLICSDGVSDVLPRSFDLRQSQLRAPRQGNRGYYHRKSPPQGRRRQPHRGHRPRAGRRQDRQTPPTSGNHSWRHRRRRHTHRHFPWHALSRYTNYTTASVLTG